MAKRTYVKPEWHAMGMPIAEAACQKGGGVVGIMGVCSEGFTANDCQTGSGDTEVSDCGFGNSAATCSSGGNATGNNCLSGTSALG